MSARGESNKESFTVYCTFYYSWDMNLERWLAVRRQKIYSRIGHSGWKGCLLSLGWNQDPGLPLSNYCSNTKQPKPTLQTKMVSTYTKFMVKSNLTLTCKEKQKGQIRYRISSPYLVTKEVDSICVNNVYQALSFPSWVWEWGYICLCMVISVGAAPELSLHASNGALK